MKLPLLTPLSVLLLAVSASALTLESFIAAIEELLAKARRERSRGTGLPTFLKLLRDQSQTTPESASIGAE